MGKRLKMAIASSAIILSSSCSTIFLEDPTPIPSPVIVNAGKGKVYVTGTSPGCSYFSIVKDGRVKSCFSCCPDAFSCSTYCDGRRVDRERRRR